MRNECLEMLKARAATAREHRIRIAKKSRGSLVGLEPGCPVIQFHRKGTSPAEFYCKIRRNTYLKPNGCVGNANTTSRDFPHRLELVLANNFWELSRWNLGSVD